MLLRMLLSSLCLPSTSSCYSIRCHSVWSLMFALMSTCSQAIARNGGTDVLMLIDSSSYLLLLINLLSFLHFAVSISILIGYVHLKVAVCSVR